ncbi:MAG TPA: peptidoglycan-binding protein [Candidatus Paceibacterota bacterium]
MLSIATVVSLSGVGALVPIAHGATVAELQAQIAQLLSQITALQSQLNSSTTTTSSSAVPASLLTSGNLTVGSKGAAVMDLQKFLNSNGYQIAASGAGSPGNETEYFGSLTKAALAKWQAAMSISPASGFFGPITRAKLSTVTTSTSSTTTTTTTTTTAPAGTGLTVTLDSVQPTATIAPQNATRIPFTKLRLTASADGAVTVNSIVVERTGLAEDAALDAVLLLDENGVQLGLTKTLNSNHQATIGEAFTVAAGQTKVLTIAGNRVGSGSRGGQTISIDAVGVNTSANVNASFPLRGSTHTINETLTIGSVTMDLGATDPGGSQTKEVGTAGYTFSSVKVTAGSTEKVVLKSIRWNQTGSAGSGDVKSAKTYIDGTAYDTIVSADGKFYSSTFGNGIVIDKGFSKEISIKGDIGSGSSRKIDFDLDKRSDLYLLGELYNYGILPPNGTDTSGSDDGAFHSSTNPWFDAYEVHINTGTITVSKDNAVAAQNIAINLANQPLGGWIVDVKGEAISVGNMAFHIDTTENTTSTVGLDDIDNLTLYDGTGKVLAGPIDPTATTADGNVTFTDTVTFPVGVTNIVMKAKLAATTAFDNNDSIAASTTPSTGWTTVTGQVTGNTVTPSPTSAVAGNTMTVKSGSLTISVSSVPIAQTVIAGVTQFEFARYVLDSAASGEDIRLTALQIENNVGGGGAATDITNCKLYDGATVVNANNVLNPSSAASNTSITFDGTGLVINKGTSKQLSLKCDLKAGATGQYSLGFDTSADLSPTGLTSGQSITETDNDSAGQQMTAATSGALSISLDTASPSYTIVAPGQTVELARIKYAASQEDIDVKQIALQLTGVASNTVVDLVGQEVSLYKLANLSTPIGTVTFSNSGATVDMGTSSAITDFRVPKDSANILVVKGVIASITNSGPLTASGDLLAVDYEGNNEGLSGNYGVGVASGATITPASNDTASNGVRIMRAYPTFEKVDLTSSERTLTAGDGKALYKFKVTANSGDVAIAKFSFSVSSSTVVASGGNNATTTKFSLYAFTDSAMSTPDSAFNGTNNPGGLLNAGSCFNGLNSSSATAPVGQNGAGSAGPEIYPDTSAAACSSTGRATTTITIPSGQSRWFRLQASVGTLAQSGTSENIQVQLEGDSVFPVNAATLMQKAGGFAGQASGVDNDAHDDFIWSPISTTTAADVDDLDWTNGYGVVGLPSTNMTAETISK